MAGTGVSVGSFSPTLGRHHIFSEYAGCNPSEGLRCAREGSYVLSRRGTESQRARSPRCEAAPPIKKGLRAGPDRFLKRRGTASSLFHGPCGRGRTVSRVCMSEDDLEARLVALIRCSSVLMRALRAARAVGPPDWLIGAGALRDRVWDHLHGFTPGPRRGISISCSSIRTRWEASGSEACREKSACRRRTSAGT